jgi:hypothetical protein
MFRALRKLMEGLVAKSQAAEADRARRLAGGEEPLLLDTATSLGDAANGRYGTLILTATRLLFVAPRTRGYEPEPGLPERLIEVPLTDIREVGTKSGEVAARIATGSLGLTSLAVETAAGELHVFRVYRQAEWPAAIEGVRREALLRRLDDRFDTLSGTDVDLKQPTE